MHRATVQIAGSAEGGDRLLPACLVAGRDQLLHDIRIEKSANEGQTQGQGSEVTGELK